MTAPLPPAPALTAEEAAREHIHRDVDEFATPGHLHHWHGVGSVVAGDMGDDDLRSEHRRMHAARPAEPTGEQTTVDRTDATDEEFRARVAVDDAAEEPDAVLVDGDWISPSREAHARDLTKSWADAAANAGCPPAFVARMRTFVEVHDRLHTAALAALRGDRAPLAGQHTTDEEADRG